MRNPGTRANQHWPQPSGQRQALQLPRRAAERDAHAELPHAAAGRIATAA